MTGWARRHEADCLRVIPLPAVLRALGAEPDRHDPHKWHTPAGVLSVHGAKFINWHRGRGGGGAIDLVMHVQDLRFPDALDWLGRQFAGLALSGSTEIIPRSPASARDAAAQRPCQLPAPHAGHLSRVRHYLTEQRRIAAATIESLIARDVLYADARANAVFVLLGKENTPVGAELRGTSARQWRGMAPGSRKDLGFFSVDAEPFVPAAPIILCESAIDALSCSLLHPGHRCVSTSGARANPAWLPTLIEQSSATYCGFDADATGDQMAAEMMTLHPAVQRLRPVLHDWNDVLRAQR
jgi:hypothetical protein